VTPAQSLGRWRDNASMSFPALCVAGLVLCCSVALANAAEREKPKHKAKPKPAAQQVAPVQPGYAQYPGASAFADEMVERRGLDRDWVLRQLAQAQRLASVQRLIMPPPAGVAKNWAAYRDRFVEPQRIAAGAAFWRANERWLAEAEDRFGVPAALIAGIVGVETFYGRVMGSFRVLDALATLAFDFPSGRSDRSAYFRSELEELLVYAQREGVEPASVRGSFAGAIGLPQFMPGSINRWAIDFDGDGHVNLNASAADTIGSIANFLVAAGWRRGEPTHFEVAVPVDLSERAVLLGPDILPSFSAAQFAERGAVLSETARAHQGSLALVMVENGPAAPSYVAGTWNFYAITRYNRSSYYALAVITLAEAVAQARARAR